MATRLEVIEAIETLKGEGPEDLTELCLVLGSKMIVAGGKADSLEEAREMLKAVIDDGSALELFGKLIEAQGGNAAIIHDTSLLPTAKYQIEVPATASGILRKWKRMISVLPRCYLVRAEQRKKMKSIWLSVSY